VIAGLIPSVRCAVSRLVGASDNLMRAISFYMLGGCPQALRSSAISQSSCSVLFFPDVSEEEAITHVYLPLQWRSWTVQSVNLDKQRKERETGDMRARGPAIATLL
jgi:hypothetical protein